MKFRMYWEEAGGHTHVRVFAGPGFSSLGKCGDLVFRNEEWQEFIKENQGFEIIPEDIDVRK